MREGELPLRRPWDPAAATDPTQSNADFEAYGPADVNVEAGNNRVTVSENEAGTMRRFASLWPDPEKVQPLAAQIGCTHHQVLIDAFGDRPDLYAWYAEKASANRWPRRYLQGQIKLGLHERQGTAVTNFEVALEPVDAEQALQATKDPSSSTSSNSPRMRTSAISSGRRSPVSRSSC